MNCNYEVIRLIRQNAGGHIIMDCVEGEILGEYILRNPNVKKELLFSWIVQLVEELRCIERIEGSTDYRYLSPFYIVLKSDGTIALLNLRAKMNQKCIDRVSKYPVMKQFYPQSGKYNDIYSFGKTVQFLLAKSNLSPPLSICETSKLKRMIDKCLADNPRKQYSDFEKLSLDFPNKKKTKKYKKFGVFGIALAAGLVAVGKNVDFGTDSCANEEQWMEVGITYFGVLEDYEKSLLAFSEIENIEKAPYFAEMSRYMLGESSYSRIDMECMIEDFLEADSGEMKAEEKYCVAQVLSRIDTLDSREQIKRMADSILESITWKEGEIKLREILANIYSRERAYEKAIREYETILSYGNSEQVYNTLSILYENVNQEDEAIEVCVDGISHNEGSVDLVLNYLRLICQSKEISKEEKEEVFKDISANYEYITEESRYQSLQKEYGIVVEEENVRLEE